LGKREYRRSQVADIADTKSLSSGAINEFASVSPAQVQLHALQAAQVSPPERLGFA